MDYSNTFCNSQCGNIMSPLPKHYANNSSQRQGSMTSKLRCDNVVVSQCHEGRVDPGSYICMSVASQSIGNHQLSQMNRNSSFLNCFPNFPVCVVFIEDVRSKRKLSNSALFSDYSKVYCVRWRKIGNWNIKTSKHHPIVFLVIQNIQN